MSVSSNLFIGNPATPAKPQTYPAGTATGSAERRFSQLLDGYGSAPTDPVALRAALPPAPPPPPAPLPVAKDIERHTDPIPPPAPTARQAETANAPKAETAAAKPAAAPNQQAPARAANGRDGKDGKAAPTAKDTKETKAGAAAEEKATVKLINKRRNDADTAQGTDLAALNTTPAATPPNPADAAALAGTAAGQAEQADATEPVICQAPDDGSTAAAPAALATLMPTVAQAVFGQAGGPAAKGDATLPDALNAKAQDGTAARGPAAGRAGPAGAEPLAAAAAGKDAASADALLGASADSTAALAAGDKGPTPAASATSFSTLLQAASAMPGMAPAATQSGAQASAPSVPVHMGTPLHDPNFAPEMAARLTVLASDGVQQAELHLNPADMGPVSVNIQVDGQQAQVAFHAQHEATREVLERSLPELAAALRDAGMTLSGGGVFQQQQQARDGSRQDGQAASGGNGQNNGGGTQQAGSPVENSRPVRRTQVGVVDTYA